jgi:hypothetical protein
VEKETDLLEESHEGVTDWFKGNKHWDNGDGLKWYLGQKDIVSFAKTLTQSEANNGGGFFMPRYCVEIMCLVLRLLL